MKDSKSNESVSPFTAGHPLSQPAYTVPALLAALSASAQPINEAPVGTKQPVMSEGTSIDISPPAVEEITKHLISMMKVADTDLESEHLATEYTTLFPEKIKVTIAALMNFNNSYWSLRYNWRLNRSTAHLKLVHCKQSHIKVTRNVT